MFINVMVTRSMDSLPHDSPQRAPRSSELELQDLAAQTPFCDPFFVTVLEDSTIADAMPSSFASFFRVSGADMHKHSKQGGVENPKQQPMEMQQQPQHSGWLCPPLPPSPFPFPLIKCYL